MQMKTMMMVIGWIMKELQQVDLLSIRQKIDRTPDDNNRLNAQFVAPLKYLNNLCRFLDLTLINWKIKLDSKRSRNCVRSEILRTTKIDANPAVNSPVLATTAITTTSAIFQITNPKLYKINDNMKFWENIKQGFKRIMSWNRYRSEILTKTKKSTT